MQLLDYPFDLVYSLMFTWIVNTCYMFRFHQCGNGREQMVYIPGIIIPIIIIISFYTAATLEVIINYYGIRQSDKRIICIGIISMTLISILQNYFSI
jgi:hypothetical protein